MTEHEQSILRRVFAQIEDRKANPRAGSYTNHLLALAATHGFGSKRVDAVIDMTGLAAVAGKRVGGIAQHHQMRTHLLLRLDQAQRIEMPCTHLAQGAQAITENALQLAQKAAVV